MNCGCETDVMEDLVGVFLPETWGLWVPLHCQEDWDNLSCRDRSVAFMLDPPYVEFLIRMDVKALFWGGSFGKSIETSAPYTRRFSVAAIA
jgi:hypothetical protein